MKLMFSPTSPFVRKVMICAIERGLEDRIEKVASAANPINQDPTIKAVNPTGKVPTLIADDGRALYDSRVICEYLDSLGRAPRLFPARGPRRFVALVLQSAADEMTDAALLARYETFARPEPLRWNDWTEGNLRKMRDSCDLFAREHIEHLEGNLDVGVIAVACALSYLDFRFPDLKWREGRPRLAKWFAGFEARPSMKATVPG